MNRPDLNVDILDILVLNGLNIHQTNQVYRENLKFLLKISKSDPRVVVASEVLSGANHFKQENLNPLLEKQELPHNIDPELSEKHCES